MTHFSEELRKILNDDKYDQQAESAGCIDLKLSNEKKAQAIIELVVDLWKQFILN